MYRLPDCLILWWFGNGFANRRSSKYHVEKCTRLQAAGINNYVKGDVRWFADSRCGQYKWRRNEMASRRLVFLIIKTECGRVFK